MAATTRSKEIVKQALRELAQEEGATLGQVLSWAGGTPGADLITAGGGSISPVHCVLAHDASLDVRTVGQHPILWDALYDNYWDFNTLLSIPAGMGLSFSFDGSSADITTTEAGVWALSYQAAVVQDDTWEGQLDTGVGVAALPRSADVTRASLVTNVVALPSDIALSQVVTTTLQATANPFSLASFYLLITRIG